MVKGMGGFVTSSLDIPLKADVAPILMLLLLVIWMAEISFALGSERGVLLSSVVFPTLSMDENVEERLISTSSEGGASMTLSSFVDGNPFEEETLNIS